MPPDEFERIVAEALEGLPPQFVDRLENVAVVVEEEPTDAERAELGLGPGDLLCGVYRGSPYPERTPSAYVGALPDRIVLYRSEILRLAHGRERIIREIQRTVVHEIGHYFGLADHEMPF